MEALLVKRLEQSVSRLEAVISQCQCQKTRASVSEPESSTHDILPRNVSAYDDAIADPLKRWMEHSTKIGGVVEEVSRKAYDAFLHFRKFLILAAGRARPSSDAELQNLISPISEKIREINRFRESNRTSPFFNHFSCLDEGINGLGWVTVKATPAPFVKEMIDALMYYAIRILVQYKEVDTAHVEWANTWKEIWSNMYVFVKKVHTTGLVWNSDPGVDPKNFMDELPTSAATLMASPPPPPPLPSNLFENLPNEKSKRVALFEQINQGSSVTAGLRKVTVDMQTHKNIALRTKTNRDVTSNEKNKTSGKLATGKENVKHHEPRIHLQDGKQWNIDYVRNDSNVNIDVDDKKQTIYIYKCENSVIKVNGKANAITLDGCKKTSVVFDGLVSQIEAINCQGVQIQTLGELPTVSIQKTDGCQVYLSKSAHGAQIVSSKSSEMNILAQLNDSDDDYTEMAVPEQFVTTISAKKLITITSDIV